MEETKELAYAIALLLLEQAKAEGNKEAIQKLEEYIKLFESKG